ncbi:hypothetical protein PSAB6_250033 [Paraburkholderia sabiae]|nr:hypothetical protein PSAB6_250033 [Paraburkholderia sabiae]
MEVVCVAADDPVELPPPPQAVSIRAATAMEIPVYFVFILSLPLILWFAAHLLAAGSSAHASPITEDLVRNLAVAEYYARWVGRED